jgi:hypothetical protein
LLAVACLPYIVLHADLLQTNSYGGSSSPTEVGGGSVVRGCLCIHVRNHTSDLLLFLHVSVQLHLLEKFCSIWWVEAPLVLPCRGTDGSNVYSYSFLTLALDGVSPQRHAWLCITPGVRTPGTHRIGSWEDLRAGVDTGYSSKNSFACARDRTLVVQLVVRHYNDSYRSSHVQLKQWKSSLLVFLWP